MNTMSLPQTAGAPTSHRWSVGRWAAPIGRFLAYGFIALLLGAIGFSLVLALLAAGLGTVVIWIGLPILVGGVAVAHGFARAERGVQSSILGTELPTPAAKSAPAGAGWVRRLVTPLTDPQYW